MKNIIMVDMQKGFINKNNMHIVKKIEEYLSQNKFDNVFYTMFKNSSDSQFVKFMNEHILSEEVDQKLVLKVIDNAVIFQKSGYGLEKKSIDFLKEKNIDEIEICGTDTDACVMAIAFQLFDSGIKPIIVSNLCASSTSSDFHKNAIEIMKNSFGKENIVEVE